MILFGLAHVRLALVVGVLVAATLVSLSTGGCPTVPTPDDNSNDNAAANENSNSDDGNSNTGTDNSNTNDSGSTNDNAGGNSNGAANGNTNGGSQNENSNDSGGNTNGSGNENTNDNGGGPVTPPTKVTLERIVQIGASVPEQSAGCTFTAFGNPVIDSAGRVAFWATYTNGAGFGGLYVWEDGTLKKVVDDDPASAGIVPGRTTQDYFGKFQKTGSFDPLAQPLAWGGGNRLIFNSEISGEKRSAGVFRWRATDENIVKVADMEQIAALFPDTYPNGAAFSPDFLQAGVSDGGLVVFTFEYTYFRNPSNEIVSGIGVFTSNGTTLNVIADSTLSQAGDVPDAGADAFYDDFRALTAISTNGDFLLNGEIQDGEASGGVYLGRGTTLYRVVDNRTTSAWPGLPADTRVGPSNGRYDAICIGNGGHISVDTKITPPSGGAQRDAVLRYNLADNTWVELVGTAGAPATALLTGLSDDGEAVVLSDAAPFFTNGATSVALNPLRGTALLTVDLTWAAAGGTINNNFHAILPYTRTAAGTPGLAFWTGEQLIIAADPVALVPDADVFALTTVSGPEIDRPSRSGYLNDSDQFVFRAVSTGADNLPNTADDVQALYLGLAEP